MSDNSYQLPENAECVFSAEQIQAGIEALAARIVSALDGKRVIALCVMNGGLIFAGQLLPRLPLDVRIDYCHATRYRNTTRGESLQWLAEPRMPLKDETVLILDDILDEGHTLAAIIGFCKSQGAREVVTAVLLDKRHDRRVDNISADFAALVVDDRYVFGFGMDYEGRYRNLDAIYALNNNN